MALNPSRKGIVMWRRSQNEKVAAPPISDLAFGSSLLASSTQYDTTSTASYAMRDGLRGTEKVPRPKEKTSLHLGDDVRDFSTSAPMAKSFKAYESKNAAVPDTSSHFVGDPVALRAASWSFAHPGDDEQHFQSTAQLQMASVLSAKGGRAPPATDQLELRRTSLQLWRSDDGATGPTMYTSTTAPLSAGYVPLPQPKKKYGLNYGDPAQLKPAGAVKGTKDAPEFCLGTTTPEERNELFRSMSSTSYKPTSRADLAVKSLPPQLRISSLQIGDGHSTHFARKETSTHPSQKKKSLTRFPLPEPPQENLVPLTELNFVPEGVSQVKGSICFGVDKLEYTTTMVNDFFLDRDSAGAVVKAETPIPPPSIVLGTDSVNYQSSYQGQFQNAAQAARSVEPVHNELEDQLGIEFGSDRTPYMSTQQVSYVAPAPDQYAKVGEKPNYRVSSVQLGQSASADERTSLSKSSYPAYDRQTIQRSQVGQKFVIDTAVRNIVFGYDPVVY